MAGEARHYFSRLASYCAMSASGGVAATSSARTFIGRSSFKNYPNLESAGKSGSASSKQVREDGSPLKGPCFRNFLSEAVWLVPSSPSLLSRP